MGQVRARKETGKLFLDFTYQGKRCREQTNLVSSAANIAKLEKLLAKIEFEIKTGKFEYAKHFPESKAVQLSVVPVDGSHSVLAQPKRIPSAAELRHQPKTPLFSEFIQEWIAENQIGWRKSHQVNILGMNKKYFLPYFGEMEVGSITRADILKFRTVLAKVPGRNGNENLSANRINKIMDPLRRVFEEAADRYEFITPFQRIKPLKIQKSDVQPFTLQEVWLILNKVRPDFKNYYTVRFFTGMRTGEIDGLKWKYVDFDRRLIKIRETIVAGEDDYTKTDASQRDIAMSEPVYAALRRQQQANNGLSEYVFCNLHGSPLAHNNVTKRVWYPLLSSLGLEKRRPYQTRHTAATLWLAAGEAPEWIARQMGHATTEMLFKVYSRYVPNLTRRDGSAFEQLLAAV